MITLYGEKVNINHFPDGTQMLFGVEIRECSVQNLAWKYENDEELLTLIYLVNHIRDTYKERGKTRMPQFTLDLFYIPNARMDRVKDDKQVFTLKYFVEVLNSLRFSKVRVLDPHSAVSTSLIKNVEVLSPKEYIKQVIYGIQMFMNREVVLYFPDEGAMNRYKSLFEDDGYQMIYGEKKRDFATGKILGLEIKGGKPDLQKKQAVLMIDDIVSYGGTMYYSAKELLVLGYDAIYVFTSHLENSVLDEEHGTLITMLNEGRIKGIYTTNSLYTGTNPKIHIIENKE